MNEKNLKFWKYPGFGDQIKPKNQLDLGQGNTPLQDHSDLLLAKQANIKLYLKREDLNPNGSFKDRALAYQISYLQQQSVQYCVLSSSGNAAISCCAFCQKTRIKPIIFVSPKISKEKLQKIIYHQPFLLFKSTKARRFAKYLKAKYKLPIINPSLDPNASLGFETLGWEIFNQLPSCSSIFSYSTSGSSVLGILHYYSKNKLSIPQINIVKINNKSKNKTIRYQQNKEIYLAIKNNHLANYQISLSKTNAKLNLLHKNGISSSFEGAACLAAVDQYLSFFKQNHPQDIICIISGTEHQFQSTIRETDIPLIENKEQLDKIFQKIEISTK